MSLHKQVRVYYKQGEVETSWTQPVLSANGTIGGDSFACAASSENSSGYQAWRAFDGITPTQLENYYWLSTALAPQWIEWYNPTPLKISQIQLACGEYVMGSYMGQPNAYQVQVSDDNTNWTTVYTGTNSSAAANITVNINENNGHKYWRLYITTAYYGYPAIREITITATQLVESIVPGTPEDYDYYEDVVKEIDKFYKGSTNIRALYKGEQLVFGSRESIYQQRNTGTYSLHFDYDFYGRMLFVGNGGGGNSSQKDSQWWYASGGSGACFDGLVRLPAGDYTLVLGTLGYGGNADNVHWYSGGLESTSSYLQDSNGNTLITVGCGAKGNTNYTSTTGGVGGTLTLGTLNVVETIKAVNGNQTSGNSSAGAPSAYDNTSDGYGAGTCSSRGNSPRYGIAGIFQLWR